jgi:hypothetical protein
MGFERSKRSNPGHVFERRGQQPAKESNAGHWNIFHYYIITRNIASPQDRHTWQSVGGMALQSRRGTAEPRNRQPLSATCTSSFLNSAQQLSGVLLLEGRSYGRTLRGTMPELTALSLTIEFETWLTSVNWPAPGRTCSSFELVNLLSPWVERACKVIGPQLRVLPPSGARRLLDLLDGALDRLEENCEHDGCRFSDVFGSIACCEDLLIALSLAARGFFSIRREGKMSASDCFISDPAAKTKDDDHYESAVL